VGRIKAAANLLLVPEGFTCVEIPQTIGGLTAATKYLIGLYMMNRKPILNWHASCLSLVTDGGDNCKPAKPARDTASKRIDGVAATITAMARAQFAGEHGIRYTTYSVG
jgi:phage terminase large subunit-like protein